MRARRSKPPTPISNALFVAGIGCVPPVSLGLMRRTLDLGEFVLISTVTLVVALATYLVSAWAYRGR